MSTLLNTLFITTDGASLTKDHETLVVRVEQEKKLQVPLLHFSGIACFGRVYVSPELMAECAERGIYIAFYSPQGRFLARVEGLPGGNVLLRRAQHRAADDAALSLSIARSMILGKVVNTRQFLLHARREAATERKAALEEAAARLSIHLRGLSEASTLDTARGLEGISAKDYFSVFGLLLKQPGFSFTGRNRHPPRDPVNALLSFGYALLMRDCAGALAGVGLDPAVGFLHEDRPGRLSLALDLMEEFRAPVVDRLVLSLLNRGQLKPADFVGEPAGAWRLTDEGRKTFLVVYQEAKAQETQHEFLGQKVAWGRVPHLQALLLARVLRRDLEEYPPFTIR